MTPTRVYVKEILEVTRNFEVHGLVHITGGGLRNLLRLKDAKFVIDDPFEPQPIFKFIQEKGNVEPKEMYQTFNMGMGFAIILAKDYADDVVDLIEKRFKVKTKVVGHVERGKGIVVPSLGISFG